jgi:hypothetical protein
MRLLPFALILLAQGWTLYANLENRFSVNFPGEPEVREIIWPSEYGAVFPGRVYRYEDGPSRYSVTVIDYTESERIHAERTNKTEADFPTYWQIDVLASVAYAAWPAVTGSGTARTAVSSDT